jgi:hypothetical protein
MLPALSREGFGRHVQIDENKVVIVGSSRRGAALIERLGLNKAVHVDRRERRKVELRLFERLLAVINEDRAESEKPPAELDALEKSLHDKFSPLFDEPPPPSDLSAACACTSGSGTGSA